jgi:serine/threonine protein phosphatase 1
MPSSERVRHLAANLRGQDYVVGDIHGHFPLLEQLLACIGFDPARDRLLCVGDLVDRGPENLRALEFLQKPWFYTVRGNHEQMMLAAVAGERPDESARALWYMNGGSWFDTVPAAEAKALLALVARLPYLLEVEQASGGHIGLAHADLPGNDWARAMARIAEAADADPVLEHVVWSRKRAGAIMRRMDGRAAWRRLSPSGVERLFFGHTPMPAAIACGNTRWLDTGAFLPDGWLSITAVAGDTLWSLPAGEDEAAPDWCVVADR